MGLFSRESEEDKINKTLESGNVLVALEKRFLAKRTKSNLFPVLGCLSDSKVFVPMKINVFNLEMDPDNMTLNEAFLKNNITDIEPEILENNKKEHYLPIFSQKKQIIKDYPSNFSIIKVPIIDCINFVKSSKINGMALDPFTYNFILNKGLISIVEDMVKEKEKKFKLF